MIEEIKKQMKEVMNEIKRKQSVSMDHIEPEITDGEEILILVLKSELSALLSVKRLISKMKNKSYAMVGGDSKSNNIYRQGRVAGLDEVLDALCVTDVGGKDEN